MSKRYSSFDSSSSSKKPKLCVLINAQSNGNYIPRNNNVNNHEKLENNAKPGLYIIIFIPNVNSKFSNF